MPAFEQPRPRGCRRVNHWQPVNIHDTLTHLFPSGVIPTGVPEHEGFFEVRGLPEEVAPQNCETLASGLAGGRLGERLRRSYLVRTPDFLLFFRACSDGPGSGQDEFVMSCGFAPLSGPLSHDLEAYALRSIASRH